LKCSYLISSYFEYLWSNSFVGRDLTDGLELELLSDKSGNDYY